MTCLGTESSESERQDVEVLYLLDFMGFKPLFKQRKLETKEASQLCPRDLELDQVLELGGMMT